MAKFVRFEEIVAWQKARALTSLVYKAVRVGEFARDYGMRDQFTRASLSIMNNVAEGFGRKNHKEFARFLEIAKGSAFEVQSISYAALDNNYINESQRAQIHALADETAALISGLANYLRKNV